MQICLIYCLLFHDLISWFPKSSATSIHSIYYSENFNKVNAKTTWQSVFSDFQQQQIYLLSKFLYLLNSN